MRNLLVSIASLPAKLLGYALILCGFCFATLGALLAKAGAWMASVEIMSITLPANTEVDLTDDELRDICNRAAKNRKPD